MTAILRRYLLDEDIFARRLWERIRMQQQDF